jgi:hypothetical protein
MSKQCLRHVQRAMGNLEAAINRAPTDEVREKLEESRSRLLDADRALYEFETKDQD